MSTRNRIASLTRQRRVLAWTLLCLLVSIAGGGSVYVYYHVPLVTFDPVCRDYERGRSSDDLLRNVTEPLSGEFRKRLVDYLESLGKDIHWLKIVDGNLFMTPNFYYSEPQKFGLPYNERGEIRYVISQKVAWEIFQERLSDGTLTDEAKQDFMTPFAPRSFSKSEPELMRPDECGFMEEFVTANGRFARN